MCATPILDNLKNNMSKRSWFILLIWWLSWLVFALFSYSLTAPNLILTNWPPYWQFQTWMWQTFFNNRVLLTYTYIGILLTLFVVYTLMLVALSKQKIILKWWHVALTLGILLFANNALSYDVFNYIFNAKMVLIYHANPHIKVALDFVFDDWTRFMHNTHTPAPYGYGWTLLSLIPSILGAQKFLLTWLFFRFWSILSLVLTSLCLRWAFYQLKPTEKQKKSFEFWQWALWLNPLVLVEIITNSHNDLWMMAPIIIASGIVFSSHRTKTWGNFVKTSLVALISFGLSISIKYATLALSPLLLLGLARPFFQTNPAIKSISNLLTSLWPTVAALACFVPLLTSRSQQFHPWYLTWVLVWLPLGMSLSNLKLVKLWWAGILTFSLTSLIRYVPYLWFGDYSSQVIMYQKWLTWSATSIWLAGALMLLVSLVLRPKQS